MSRQSVASLADGDSVDEVYLAGDRQLRANRNGNPYLQVDLRDRSGTITGRQWNATDEIARSFEPGDFVRVQGKVQLFQGALQMIVTQIRRVDPNLLDLSEFLPHTQHDVGTLLQKLKEAIRRIGNPHLRALSESFLMDEEFLRDFCKCPAGVRMHHAFVGGLLEHVVDLIDGAERLAPLYPGVDLDLVKIGVFLHDIGKVRELSYQRSFGYTDEGQLIGHIVIGVEMVNEKAKQVPELTGEPFPAELLLRLKHMVLSHHGSLEFGSPVLPMTPEAILLASLDHLDSRVHIFTRDIREDRNSTSAWTPYSSSLERRLFKGSTGAGGGDGNGPLD